MNQNLVQKSKATYELAAGFTCQHCNEYPENEDIIETYKALESIQTENQRWIEGDPGYLWIEDVKCSKCGKEYSRINGC